MVIMQIWSILAKKKSVEISPLSQYLDRPNPLSKMATVTENQEIL